jgi:peptide-methionine (R)-S-oxide reductase
MNKVATSIIAVLLSVVACTRETAGRQEEPMSNGNWEKTAARWKDLPVKDGRVVLDEESWRQRLSAEEFRICRQAGTERAHTGRYWDTKAKGVFHCVACGLELFDAETKFDSGTGWPSFWEPVSEGAVENRADDSLGTHRTEVLCSRCGSHLGHVFSDGPEPTGQRYCMNSTSLLLREK